MGQFFTFFPCRNYFAAIWGLYRIELLLRHGAKFIYFLKIVHGVLLKPSPYFADKFRFFLFRFANEDKIFRWFRKQAGESTTSFSFPNALKGHPKTLVFLPRDPAQAKDFLNAMPKEWYVNIHLFAHESMHSIISSKRCPAIYYSDMECRYGEAVFNKRLAEIQAVQADVGIFLGEPYLPRLYLMKLSGAACRIGFNCESLYPFLNLSLHPEHSSEAALISKYYGVR